jgi:propane monooxygenase reductase subunit
VIAVEPVQRVHRVTLDPVGIEIECGEDETVLAAAFRQGYNLVHGCREGQCAACKSFLLEGEVYLERYSSFALSESEEAQGYTLLCRAMPETDLAVELLHFDPEGIALANPIREGIGRVAAIEPLTHDVTRLVLAIEQPEDFAFRPGEYADLRIPGTEAKRSYSMANLPGEGTLEFMVKRYPGGRFSSLLEGSLRPGDRLQFTGPWGSCYLREAEPERPVILVGGGSGMAPVLGLLRELACVRSPRPVRFLYGARAARDLFSLDVLEGLGRQLGDFVLTPVLSEPGSDDDWNGAAGFVHEEVERALAAGLAEPDAYLAGPPPMVDALLDVLERAGVPGERTFFDKFTTAAETAEEETR